MMIKARIIRSSQRTFDCRVLAADEGGEFRPGQMVEATALANLLKAGEVVVGDYVQLTKEDALGGTLVISSVDARKNELFRMIPRENKKKVSASNCDVVVIVKSVSFPQFKRGLLDRYLVRASQWGIPAVVVFNKMDEFAGQFDLDWEKERLASLQVKSFCISAVDHGAWDFAALKTFLGSDTTSIFQGQSGVGKSKIISALTDGQIQLKSRQLGKVNKGAHTTSWTELIYSQGFSLIDSPGIRSFSLDDIPKEDLLIYFPDLNEQATHCRFPNCQHQESSKGCSFHDNSDPSISVERRKILLSRLESFQQIYKEVSARPSWEKNDH